MRQEGARFLGGVYATHPRMNRSSESLVIDLPRTAGRTRTLVAEQAVKFKFSGEKGDRLEGAGDKAVYVFGVDNSATKDLLTLSGNPAVLQTTNVTTRSKTIIYDGARNLLRTPGYSIAFTNQVADTNLLMLPKSKLTR